MANQICNGWLLTRHCSEYTEGHLLLGLFLSVELGQQARGMYVHRLSHDEKDFHAEQVYHRVDLEKDVRLIRVQVHGCSCTERNTPVWVVLDTCEGFGQIAQHPVWFDTEWASVCSNIARLQEEGKDEYYVSWYEVDQLAWNVLRFDNRARYYEPTQAGADHHLERFAQSLGERVHDFIFHSFTQAEFTSADAEDPPETVCAKALHMARTLQDTVPAFLAASELDRTATDDRYYLAWIREHVHEFLPTVTDTDLRQILHTALQRFARQIPISDLLLK